MKEKLLKWLRAAGVRALKTVAQTAVATIGTGAVISEVDWRMVLSASILAGILSLLTSIAGLPEVEKGAQQQGMSQWQRRAGRVPRPALFVCPYISGAKMRSTSRAMRRRPLASHSSGVIWWQRAMVSRKSRFTSSTGSPP